MTRLPTALRSGHLLQPRTSAGSIIITARRQFLNNYNARRCQSTTAAAHIPIDQEAQFHDPPPPPPPSSSRPLPSPSLDRATRSAKLAALHARLSLSKRIPLQTLARTLVTPSADPSANFNNSNLAFLGSTIINYHVLEYLVCKWPRLPMSILYETLRAYAGTDSLSQIARRWGVDAAAAPGEEVDPGLLQWQMMMEEGRGGGEQQQQKVSTTWGYVRAEAAKGPAWRRGLSSRVVLDDDFGDVLPSPTTSEEMEHEQIQNEAFESFVQAVIGSIHAHCGREEAKAFVTSHILSRQFDPSVLFHFHLPTRELAMLCAREGFEPPLARLESETGRLSRTPVYVVGIYSGQEKLGEGTGASLDIARRKASMNSLKAWYLYSPSNKVRVPSDMMEKGAKPWKAPYIDMGEII